MKKILIAVLAALTFAAPVLADPTYPQWVNAPNKVTAASAPLVLSGTTISLPAADGTHNGYLSTSAQTIAGAKNLTGNFSIATNKFTVAAASGNTVVAGTCSVTGDVAVGSNTFTVTAASGNTSVGGTLGVTGATTLTGGVAVGSGGTAITLSKACTATLGTSAITNGTTATQTITCAGAAAGAVCMVGGPAALEAGLIQSCVVSATDTILLRTANVTAAPITPAGSQTVRVRFFNP